MVDPQMVMYEEEFIEIQKVCDKLVRDANALVVFIVDKNGQLISTSGEYEHLDTTSLASLTAGNIAATGGMAKLLKELELHRPGVNFYTHISDQYSPFHTQLINTNTRDATYVLDGLLYHGSDLNIEEHYTDTAGFTDHVFGLCHLLGFRFACFAFFAGNLLEHDVEPVVHKSFSSSSGSSAMTSSMSSRTSVSVGAFGSASTVLRTRLARASTSCAS